MYFMLYLYTSFRKKTSILQYKSNKSVCMKVQLKSFCLDFPKEISNRSISRKIVFFFSKDSEISHTFILMKYELIKRLWICFCFSTVEVVSKHWIGFLGISIFLVIYCVFLVQYYAITQDLISMKSCFNG